MPGQCLLCANNRRAAPLEVAQNNVGYARNRRAAPLEGAQDNVGYARNRRAAPLEGAQKEQRMAINPSIKVKRYFEDVEVGEEIPQLVKPPVTHLQLVRYAGASGDFNPLHTDPK